MRDQLHSPPELKDTTSLTPPTPRRRGIVHERPALHGLDYPIAPSANRLAYMLGGLTFFGILLLIVTGVLLDQYYNPSPVAAHDSILYIMTRVPLGSWIRGLHFWGASIVLVTVFLHMSYVFWRRSYIRPREVMWWAGVGLFLVLFGLAFTGTVLPADQEGGEALAHAVAGEHATAEMMAVDQSQSPAERIIVAALVLLSFGGGATLLRKAAMERSDGTENGVKGP